MSERKTNWKDDPPLIPSDIDIRDAILTTLISEMSGVINYWIKLCDDIFVIDSIVPLNEDASLVRLEFRKLKEKDLKVT